MTAPPPSVVSADWLAEHRADLIVADVRWYLDGRSGRDAYEQGHIPGAVFVDLDTDLSGPPTQPGGRHPLPSPSHFASAMSRHGIDGSRPVVAYDDAGGAIAARLWWLLSVLGHPAGVLDGGISAWAGELSTTGSTPGPAHFSERPWPADRFADADAVAALPASVVLLDARDTGRYRGEPNDIDTRFGHIPGARSAPFRDNLDPETGRLRDDQTLARRFGELGALAPEEVVAYCGSGVTACHDLLVLDRLGQTRTRLYVGSWSDWAGDPTRPVETGDPT